MQVQAAQSRKGISFFFLADSHNDVLQEAQQFKSIVAHSWHQVCLSAIPYQLEEEIFFSGRGVLIFFCHLYKGR